jgi:hypothetical protein
MMAVNTILICRIYQFEISHSVKTGLGTDAGVLSRAVFLNRRAAVPSPGICWDRISCYKITGLLSKGLGGLGQTVVVAVP